MLRSGRSMEVGVNLDLGSSFWLDGENASTEEQFRVSYCCAVGLGHVDTLSFQVVFIWRTPENTSIKYVKTAQYQIKIPRPKPAPGSSLVGSLRSSQSVWTDCYLSVNAHISSTQGRRYRTGRAGICLELQLFGVGGHLVAIMGPCLHHHQQHPSLQSPNTHLRCLPCVSGGLLHGRCQKMLQQKKLSGCKNTCLFPSVRVMTPLQCVLPPWIQKSQWGFNPLPWGPPCPKSAPAPPNRILPPPNPGVWCPKQVASSGNVFGRTELDACFYFTIVTSDPLHRLPCVTTVFIHLPFLQMIYAWNTLMCYCAL